MKRVAVIQHFIDKNNYTKYLEIGIHKGYSFLSIKCKNKIAVDPFFQINIGTKLKWLFKIPYNFRNNYFEITSDHFFQRKGVFLNNFGKIDIVFIDGLHTFEGSLKDALNSLKYLTTNGVIVMHDCYPPNKASATPAKSYSEVKQLKPTGWNGLWCGDVWKTIVYLRERYSDHLEIFVLNTDFGLGVVKIKVNKKLNLEINQELFKKIDNLDFNNLRSDPESLIGLRDKNYIYE